MTDDLPVEVPDEALDILVEGYVEAGFTLEEAQCFADEMFGGLDAGNALAVFETCEISLERLADIGG